MNDTPQPEPTYHAGHYFDPAVWTHNIWPPIREAIARQEDPEARQQSRAALEARAVRFLPSEGGLVVVLGGQDLALIEWSQVFSPSGEAAND